MMELYLHSPNMSAWCGAQIIKYRASFTLFSSSRADLDAYTQYHSKILMLTWGRFVNIFGYADSASQYSLLDIPQYFCVY
jgi:hypothetical protein